MDTKNCEILQNIIMREKNGDKNNIVFADEENLFDKPSARLLLPDNEADFVYVTDLFPEYLEQHSTRAQEIISLMNAYEH